MKNSSVIEGAVVLRIKVDRDKEAPYRVILPYGVGATIFRGDVIKLSMKDRPTAKKFFKEFCKVNKGLVQTHYIKTME